LNFLIDECLTQTLVWLARRHGYDADHVVAMDLGGTLDPDLMPLIVTASHTFVTNNARDFLRLFSLENPHAGLVIIRPSVALAAQVELFEAVLADLHADPDMANRAIEADYAVAADGSEEIRVRRFDLAG